MGKRHKSDPDGSRSNTRHSDRPHGSGWDRAAFDKAVYESNKDSKDSEDSEEK